MKGAAIDVIHQYACAARVLEMHDPKSPDPSSFMSTSVGSFGDCQIVIPRLRWIHPELLEHVGAVIDHVEVTVERNCVGASFEGGAELTEELTDVVPLQVWVVVDTVGDVLQDSCGYVVDHPLRREDERVVAVCASHLVRENALEQVGEWYGYNIDLRAGQFVELRCPPLQRFSDLRTGEGHDVDLDTVELATLGRRKATRARGD